MCVPAFFTATDILQEFPIAIAIFLFLLITHLNNNIFQLFQVLVQFFITASSMEIDYCHQKVSAQVASKFIKRVKT